MKKSGKKTQSSPVKDDAIKLTLRGDINRMRQFVARNIARQVVKKMREEDAQKADTPPK